MEKVKVALLGAGFISEIHLESYRRFVPHAEIVAVYARDEMKARQFARKHDVPSWFCNVSQLLKESDCDVVDICLPNHLHAAITIEAAGAGKHIIIEKPLALSMREADDMIEACRKNNVLLMYAEELCFAPKYEKVRKMVEEGAVGKVYMIKQSEKHSGPHSSWFYDPKLAGGGVLMDMGCHAFGWFRWMLKGKKAISVYATMNTVLHTSSEAEDNSVVIVEFEDGITCIAENSWARHGGMDDRSEVYGTDGVVYADLFMGNAALAYSRKGYGYAMEKADTTVGWTFPIFEEAFNQGYPHELAHFIECVRTGSKPLVTGEDGKAVLEIIHAAYASAASGTKISLPFQSAALKPIDLWKTQLKNK